MAKCGLDVSRDKMNVFVRFEDESTKEWEVRLTRESVEKCAKELPSGSMVALETSGSTWAVAKIFQNHGHSVKVLNSVDVEHINKSTKKTDPHDAKALCDLLDLRDLETVWLADEKTMRLRNLLSHREKIFRQRVMIKNEIQAILVRNLIPARFSDAFCEIGVKWLKNLNVPEEERLIIGNNIALLKQLKQMMEDVERKMAQLCGADDPFVRAALQLEGVGPSVALALRARSGDITRFPEAKKYAAYFGLTPGIKQSGQPDDPDNRGKHITKRGCPLIRRIMSQAAHAATLTDGKMRKFHTVLVYANKVHKSEANVAVANKMLRILWTILTKQQVYKSIDARLYESKLKRFNALITGTARRRKAPAFREK
jgi:transposase